MGGSRSQTIRPGGRALVRLALLNACERPTAERLSLALPDGRVRLGIGPDGRCDQPDRSPAYAVSGFPRG
jgi:hypothetical protein